MATVGPHGVAVGKQYKKPTNKFPATWKTNITVRPPVLRFNYTSNTFSSGKVETSAAGTQWDNVLLTAARLNAENPISITTAGGQANGAALAGMCWGLYANRLPTFYEEVSFAVDTARTTDLISTMDLNWAAGCMKYKRYRVLKCKITIEPISIQADGAIAKYFAMNVVHRSFNTINRPIYFNKPSLTTTGEWDESAQPLRTSDMYANCKQNHCTAWAGVYVKVGDPRQGRTPPFTYTWDRTTWYFNEARFPKEMQRDAYYTTLPVSTSSGSNDWDLIPTALDIPSASITSTIEQGRQDNIIWGVNLDSPIIFEPYLTSPSPWSEGADTSQIFTCSMTYTVEFSEPRDKQEDDFSGTYFTGDIATAYGAVNMGIVDAATGGDEQDISNWAGDVPDLQNNIDGAPTLFGVTEPDAERM